MSIKRISTENDKGAGGDDLQFESRSCALFSMIADCKIEIECVASESSNQ